ncbi:YT521-B-like domain-containing protein [Hyaloscypha finlandica]|nr:YT521-B-like domain-containing protein [Hyaloscypha finlandica]
MGDTPTGRPIIDGDFQNTAHGARANSTQRSSASPFDESDGPKAFQGNSHAPGSQGHYPHGQSFPTQQHGSQGQQDHFNMGPLGTALPDMSYMNYGNAPPQRYPSGPSPPAHLYQLQSMPQLGGPASMNTPATNLPYNVQYQTPYQSMYGPGQSQTSANSQSGLNIGNQFYQGQAFMGQAPVAPYFIQPGQYALQGQMYSANSSSGQYGPRGSFTGDNRPLPQQRSGEYQTGTSIEGVQRRSSSIGHAIWIGNLPPQTDLMSLVLHVCKETSGLESLFLISKSNCAFANFKDEASCSAAQVKIHDSRFQTVRLVSRLRRSSVGTGTGVSVPRGPAALTPPSNPVVARSPSPRSEMKIGESVDGNTEDAKDGESSKAPKDKFFIVKSLTVEDLELSVRNGIWATQSHNEEFLNKAYQTADNVYLVFSANKSGEYFGYAKMTSPINDDPAAAIEFAPKATTVEDPELPKAIPTPATEFAPKGRIIDDSARGTIFWEAERDEIDEVEEEEEIGSNRSDSDSAPPSKAWGKPFKLEWISTTRLPFYRTRGLRNPWNSNREVKIARDGTELETTVGRRLLGLFHRLPSPVAPNDHGLPLPMMDGYPALRQFP